MSITLPRRIDFSNPVAEAMYEAAFKAKYRRDIGGSEFDGTLFNTLNAALEAYHRLADEGDQHGRTGPGATLEASKEITCVLGEPHPLQVQD